MTGVLARRDTADGVELVDTRTGEVVVRTPLSPEAVRASAQRYADAVSARQERLARSAAQTARVLGEIWNQPCGPR